MPTGYKWVCSVRQEQAREIRSTLAKCHAIVCELRVCHACGANLYIDQLDFFAFIRFISARMQIQDISILREAPKWMIVQGSQESIDSFLKAGKDFLQSTNAPTSISGRVTCLDPMTDANNVCRVSLGHVVLTKEYVQTSSIQLISDAPPWVSEDVLDAFCKTIQISPLTRRIKKLNCGSCVELEVIPEHATRVQDVRFVMQWEDRILRFHFVCVTPSNQHCSASPAAGVNERGGHTEDRADKGEIVDASIALTPMPRPTAFARMTAEEKHDVLKQSLAQRLDLACDSDSLGKVEHIVSTYNGSESELYDTISQADSVTLNDILMPDKVGATQTSNSDVQLQTNDIVEILAIKGEGGVEGRGNFVRIDRIQHDCKSNKITGTLVGMTGETLSTHSLFEQPVKMKRVTDKRGDYWVISHPAAITHMGRPYGTKWINCQKDAEAAQNLAIQTKNRWGAELGRLALKHRESVICLCANKTCSGNITIGSSILQCVHVSKWKVLQQGTLGAVALTSYDISSKKGIRAACEQITKDRGKKPNINQQ